MIKKHSILKNSFFLMVGNISHHILSFFIVLLITRYLGPEKYGQYIFVISFVSIFAVIWSFGFDTLMIRDISRDKLLTNIYSGNVIIIKSILFFVVFSIMLSSLYFLNYSPLIKQSAMIFALCSFLGSISSIPVSVFSAWNRFDFPSLLSVLRPILLLPLLLLVMQFAGGILEIFYCYVIQAVTILVIAFVILKNVFVLPDFKEVQLSNLYKLVKDAFPFMLTAIISTILFKIDHLMLSKIGGDEKLGYYGSAYIIFEIIIGFFPMLIMKASFPVMSEKYKTNKKEFENIYSLLFKYLLVLGIPISLGILFLGDEIILVLYGNDYISAGILLSLLGGGIWIFFLNSLMGWTITAMDKQKDIFIIGSSAMVLNIILNIIFIPKFGGQGAALSTVLSEFIAIITMTIIIKKNISFKFNLEIVKIILVSIAMSLSILFLKNLLPFNPIINLILIITIASFIYLSLSFLLKTIVLEDFALLR